MFGFKKLIASISSMIEDLLRRQDISLEKQRTLINQQNDKLGQMVTRLEQLEKRMNGFAFTAVEASNLVGELRAMRHLLDERGQYKQLDKPMTEKELI